jgi:phosphohistidine phosphatase
VHEQGSNREALAKLAAGFVEGSMDLYLIRHADALPLGEGGIQDDAERPLSETGVAQCAPLAEAFARRGVHLDQVVTSPLLRARQTAEAILQHLPSPPPLHLCDHLAPGGRRRKLTRFIRGLEGTSLGLVGHMPDLALFAAWLIGSKKAQVEIAKAGFACVRFESRPDKDLGVLISLLPPQWYVSERS